MAPSGNDLATPVAARSAQSRMDFSHKEPELHIEPSQSGTFEYDFIQT